MLAMGFNPIANCFKNEARSSHTAGPRSCSRNPFPGIHTDTYPSLILAKVGIHEDSRCPRAMIVAFVSSALTRTQFDTPMGVACKVLRPGEYCAKIRVR
jgi:hypothetical protein